MSRHHLEIEVSSSVARIVNLSEKTPTRLNGRLIADAPISPGDAIQAGATRLRVSIQGEKVGERPGDVSIRDEAARDAARGHDLSPVGAAGTV